MNLFDLPIEWRQFSDECDLLEDGVLTPELEQRLATLADATAAKVDAACYAMKCREIEAEQLRIEARRLTQRAVAAERIADSIKARVQAIVEGTPHNGKLKTPRNTLYMVAGRQTVGVADGYLLEAMPGYLLRVKRELDKDAADQLLKMQPDQAAHIGLVRLPGKPWLGRR